MKKLIKISSLSMIASTIAISLILTGCGSDDPDNEGNHLPDVNIVQNNKTVNVGTKVNLTSVAVDVDGDDLTYEWKFVSKPAGSLATLTSTNTTTTKKASFTADKAGKYVVQFSAKDSVDAVGKDTVTITAKEAGTPAVGGGNKSELTITTPNDVKGYKFTSAQGGTGAVKGVYSVDFKCDGSFNYKQIITGAGHSRTIITTNNRVSVKNDSYAHRLEWRGTDEDGDPVSNYIYINDDNKVIVNQSCFADRDCANGFTLIKIEKTATCN